MSITRSDLLLGSLLLPSAFAAFGERAVEAPAIGVNLDGNAPWMTDRKWVDAAKLFSDWGHPNQPWEEIPYLKLTADGYPMRDAGTYTYLRGYPDGTYKLRFAGIAKVEAGGMGRLAAEPVRAGGFSTADLVVERAKGEVLTLRVTGIDANDPLRDLRLIMPGYSVDTKDVFTVDYLKRVAPFRTLRFIDWTHTNDVQDARWSKRAAGGQFPQTGARGLPWEDLIALANAAKKDVWINVPDRADDGYVHSLAKLLRDGLPKSSMVYLEFSSELWNSQWAQAAYNLESSRGNAALAAAPDTAPEFVRLKGDTRPRDPMQIARPAQQVAFKLKHVADIFREEFGGEAARVRPVLAGSAANSVWIEEGLKFLKQKYGDPTKIIDAIAISAYVGTDELGDADKPALTLDDLFGRLNEALGKVIAERIRAHKALADQFGVKLYAYEGGQHLLAWNPALGGEVNEALKLKAQDDPRMGKLLKDLVALWQREGGGLFMHYSHISPYGKTGYWGLMPEDSPQGSVKWNAMMDVLGQKTAAR